MKVKDSVFWSENALKEEIRNEVVRAGKIYQEFEESEKAALEAYLSTRDADKASRPSSAAEAVPEKEPDDPRVHFPLSGEHDMRVLELYPGEFDPRLHFKTHACSAEFEIPAIRYSHSRTMQQHTQYATSNDTGKPIWYTALSYVWGSIAAVERATCNGKTFEITQNLDIALRHLRRSDVSVMLWIDQICINQQDLDERTQQVLLMGRIYERAWNTLVWLGEEADGSSDAIDLIIDIGDIFQYLTDETAPDPADLERVGLPGAGSMNWFYLDRILRRPWFQRVWVIQEVVLSRFVQFQCGYKSLSWDEISMFASCMTRHDLTQFLMSAENSSVKQISEVACIRIRMYTEMKDVHHAIPGKALLLDTLADARGTQATDPRDKVLGIMKMTSTTIHPDYSKEVFEVYTEAAEKCIQKSLLFNVFCCVDHEQPIAGCPSWVPNWGIPRQTTSLAYGRHVAGVYWAAQDSKPEFKQFGTSLSVVGIMYNTVSNIFLAADSCLKDLTDQTSPTARFVIESMDMAIEHCQPYPSHSGLFHAFWQTLVAGKDESGLRKSPPDYANIFGFLLDSATSTSPSMPDQPTPKRKLTLANLQTRRPGQIYRQIQIAFEAAVKCRAFVTTSKRYMGMFPRGSRPGDQVCVFLGGHVPFVLRSCESTSGEVAFQLIGECYVHGIMGGEVMQMTDLKREEILVV